MGDAFQSGRDEGRGEAGPISVTCCVDWCCAARWTVFPGRAPVALNGTGTAAGYGTAGGLACGLLDLLFDLWESFLLLVLDWVL